MPSVPAHFESRQLADCPAYLRNLAFRYNCPAAGSCSVAARFRLAELILSAICRRRVGTVSRSHSLLWIAARHCLILVAAIGISLHWVAAIAGCTGRCRTTIRLAVLVCTRMSGIAVRTVGWYKVPVLDIDPRTGICPAPHSFLSDK